MRLNCLGRAGENGPEFHTFCKDKMPQFLLPKINKKANSMDHLQYLKNKQKQQQQQQILLKIGK